MAPKNDEVILTPLDFLDKRNIVGKNLFIFISPGWLEKVIFEDGLPQKYEITYQKVNDSLDINTQNTDLKITVFLPEELESTIAHVDNSHPELLKIITYESVLGRIIANAQNSFGKKRHKNKAFVRLLIPYANYLKYISSISFA